MDEIVSGYRYLTGKAPIVPKWALGFWQSRERYRSQNEILSTVKTFREKIFLLIILLWTGNTGNPMNGAARNLIQSRFPDPKGMIDTLHQNVSMLIL